MSRRNENIYVFLSFSFLIIILLVWYMIFMGNERKDESYKIIEKPIMGFIEDEEEEHRNKESCFSVSSVISLMFNLRYCIINA